MNPPVYCVRWDSDAEVLVEYSSREWTARAMNMELDGSLALFSEEWSREWYPLVRFVSMRVISRMGIPAGTLFTADETRLESLRDDGIADRTISVCPRFTNLKRGRRTSRSMTPTEVTKYNMDRTEVLKDILRVSFAGSWSELLGELQASFLIFLFIYSMAALEQWKHAVDLLCSCDDAISESPDMFQVFMDVLEDHLRLTPSDFFMDELSSESFLRPALLRLNEIIQESTDETATSRRLRKRHEEFNAFIAQRFGWEIPNATTSFGNYGEDEDAPIYVPEDFAQGNPDWGEARSLPPTMTNPEFTNRVENLEWALDHAQGGISNR